MATFTERLALLVDARTDGAVRELKKLDGTTKSTGKTADETQKKYSNLSIGLKAGLAGAAAYTGAKLAHLSGVALKGVIDQAREAAKVSRITDAAIRSTGGAAGVTADHVGKLADSISRKVGVDDEAIQSSENLLLTFTKVRNEAGKGNDIFDQASQSIVDMTAALHGGTVTEEGLRSSTIQLGKALNDPIKGMTALRRVGVSFTQQQQDQIKALVESGHQLDAQKVILQELQKEFGGAAAAAADPAQKLSVAWENLQENVGTLLLPAMNTASDAASKLTGFFNDASPATQKMAVGVTAVGLAALVAGPRIATMGVALKEAGVSAGGLAKGLGLASVGMLAFELAAETSLKQAADDTKSFGEKAFQVFGAIFESAGMAGTAIAKEAGHTKDAGEATKDTTTASDEYQKLLGSSVIPQVEDLAGATDDAYQAQKLLHGEVIGVTESEIAYRDKLADWTKSVKDSTKAGKDHAHSLSLNNQLGRDNVSNLLDLVDLANSHADAVYKDTGSVEKSNDALRTGRERLLDQAEAAGFNRKKVAELIDKYLQVPKKAATEVKQPGMAQAKRDADTLKNKMIGLEGVYSAEIDVKLWKAKKGNLYFQPYYSAADGALFNGNGNLLSQSEQHVAQVAKPGQWRVWAEDETGGEAYIPLAMSKRKRSTAILKAVAEGFGYQLDAMARGGVRTTPSELETWARSNIQQGASTTADLVAALINKHYGVGNLGAVLQFAYSQVGKPYLWGAFGPTGYDCSGFMSALVNVARGHSPYSRVGSTSSFPWGGFDPGTGPFMIGSFQGNPGHMAGTVLGTNVESAGGVGVRVGSSARGARSGMFGGNIWHLASFDRGGMLYPLNRSGGEERILSPNQTRNFEQLVRVLDRGHTAVPQSADVGPINVRVFIGDRELKEQVRVVVDERSRREGRRADLYARGG